MATSVTLKPNAIDISGSTSGTTTLQAPAVAGTTTITLPSTTGTLLLSTGTASAATNLAGGSNGTIPYQSASGTTQMLAAGTSGQVLQSNGASAPSWVNAATGSVTSVAMTVPSFLSVSGSPVTSSGTLAVTLSGTALPIANGGTNSTATPTAGAVPYGTGTAFAFTSAGTAGQVLTSNGASAPTWATAATGGTAIGLVRAISINCILP